MQPDAIRKYWMDLNQRCGSPPQAAWHEIDRITFQYSTHGRHYHNLDHLAELVKLQRQYAPLLLDNDSVLYAIYFHDFIYQPKRKDNELKSAEEAIFYLRKVGAPVERQDKVYRYILATAGHQPELSDPDLDYFLDFDLSILSAPEERYKVYAKNIRREYRMYSWLDYRNGRVKVLQHFLAMPHIYRTELFREKYERRARLNLERELEKL
ncbi:HD domain-containing protein [Chitinophaga rhizosphaerae]|uniref:HD domain-containing protein n=1 Tax=Chitinophaga rhizosphaerae TaxID=1864947 RepID=UPI000F802B28|nr:hypothetical protein [Chitinophaga rhizosphaerae]